VDTARIPTGVVPHPVTLVDGKLFVALRASADGAPTGSTTPAG
jgi:hypothetical protein